MSYTSITKGINKSKSITSWSSFLIEYNHNKRPNEYTCYDLNFSTDDLLSATISTMCDTFLSIVNKYERKILEYTGETPKHVVDKLSTKNPIVAPSWNALIESINNSDDTSKFKDIKASAYVFVGSYTSDDLFKNIYLITRKNPILPYKKVLFTSKNNTVTKADEPLVQFSKSFDALVYNDTFYMINSNCESIFNMEYTHKIVCKKHLDELSSINIISNFNTYRSFASSGQNPKKFITYDSSLVTKLEQPIYRDKLSTLLRIPLDPKTKQFNLEKEDDARKFTSAICGKTKINLLDNGVCEVPSSVPLNL